MAITYFGSKKLMGTKVDRVTDSLGSSADGAISGASTTPVHSQSTAGSASGVDLYQTTGGGGWGMRFNSGHAIVGSKLKKFKASSRIANASNRSDQNMTCKVYDGIDKTTVRASSNSINTSVLDQGNTYEDVEFTFSSPVVINAGDVVVISCPNDLGTAGAWGCEIKESADTNGHFVTWVDNGSFTLQTGRCLKYDATLELVPKLGSGCYSFDGTDDRITTDQRVNGLHDGTGGSVTLWVKPTLSADNDIIFNTHNGSGSGVGVEIKFDSSNRIKVASTNASDGWVTANSTTALSNGTWYHVAVTLDTDTKYRIYINGTLEATSSAFTPKTVNSTNPYYLGDSPDSGNYYDGLLDDVGIYSRALTTTEITALYNSGTGALVSSLSNKAGLKAHYTMDTIDEVTLFTTDDFSGESYAHSGTWYNNSNSSHSLDGDKSTSAEGSIYTSHTSSGHYTVDLGASADRTIFVRWDGFAYGGGGSHNAGFKVETSPDNSTWTQRADHLYQRSNSYTREAWIDDLSGTWRYVRFSCRKVSGGNTGIHHVGFGVDWFGNQSGDLCKNDKSGTSDLEVQTNLLQNSTFLQIDGTPNYYWKQSDNTWAEDESIPYVWSTNSAKITKRTSSATSGGTQSSFMIAGMREPSSGNSTYADVQSWNGSSWSSGTSKPQATIHASGGGDSNTDHMSAGGYHCCDNAGHNETHEWNGSSWSTSGTLPSAGWGFVGDGNTTTGIMGGNMSYGFGNRCATYNGSSWTNVSDGVGIVGTGTIAGKEASAIHGYQGDCETWDGSAWTTVADLTAGSSGANGGSGGDSSQALFFGGGTIVTDIWNGTTFKAGSNYVSTSAGDTRSCNVDSNGVGLSTWDGGTSAGNGDVFKYSR